ncbi:hypothetical protein VOLCADRAFT_108801 [Volvox carteri f. nagariensis]|uniref:Uncharacterized protein n=1 Tax=Volvox carteri f. nagariensis TaxID=3068 RepID=D8UMQ9_VOLCA|nr:uncharacterized protein VOLCADRAFT_108801 [Volvox carteri f. nagariensis]EFJ38990.1 hypothetical protein VOLCADRAFT_108801 [Volvox carteri f. nagariensis]|eukprot:XP_002959945.1 hypothetical protein VOLCADRAFT_108801 [Volvox carteri f. nagariensis]
MFSDLLSQRGLRSTAPLPGPLPMPGARPARPAFLQQLAERRRRVIGGMSCPGLRDECYACLYGCSQAGVLGPRDIEAAIMDTGGDAGRALAWYPGLLMAWWFAKADTFFRENQLPAYYGEIDSIRCMAVCRVSGPQQKSPIEAFSRRCFTASRCDTASRDRPKCHCPLPFCRGT